MIKHIFSGIALCAIGLLVSCEESDLPGLGKEANTTFSGEKLALTYGGSAMPGKQIKFHTYDGEKASIEMSGVLDLAALFPSENLPEIGLLAPGVVPGEIITQLENVPLTLGADGSTYSFSGTDTSNGRELTYSGQVSADKMTMDIQVKMPDDNLMGTWNLASGQSLAMVWDSEGTIDLGGNEISTSMVASMAGPLLSQLIAGKVQTFSFHEDGNVVLSYMKSGADTWQDSPLNMAQYYLKDGKLYAQLNVSEILSTITRTRANSITDIIGMLRDLVAYMSEGIPLTYEQAEDGSVKLTLATEDAKALLKLLTVDFISDKIVEVLPENAQSIAQPLLEKLPELLDATTTLEISLKLNK